MGDVGSCCCSREEEEAVSPYPVEALRWWRELCFRLLVRNELAAGTNHVVFRWLYAEPESE